MEFYGYEIHRTAAFAAKIGVYKNTVKAWSLKGKLPDRRTPSGHRHCTEADVERYFGVERISGSGRTVVHGRVSRRAQGDDLRSQQQAMETFRLGAGLAVDEWLTEIVGGLDCQRPVFRSLMERIGNREPGLLPVVHRDRLIRFGFDWFEHFARQHGCTITVVNQESLSPRTEMVEDLMAVVHTFSGRLHGLRAYHRQIQEAANDG